MANNLKNKKKAVNAAIKKAQKEPSLASSNKSSYLDEKDQKAAAFLKKHPVPASFFK